MRIGAHVRTSSGLVASVRYAAVVGCECIQIFAKSPLQWRSPRRDRHEVELFWDALRHAGIALAATHGSYLINLASPDDGLWRQSIEALAEEIRLAHVLGAPAVVTHLGSSAAAREQACERAARGIAAALEAAAELPVMVYVENASGAGNTVGATSEELIAVAGAVPPGLRHRVAVCLDSCHAHVAGYDLAADAGWEALLAPLAGASIRIPLIHANDAMFPSGSHRDRHACIGEGTIGTDGFGHMMRRCCRDIGDVIVEMPGTPPEKDALNVERLKAIRREVEMQAPRPRAASS
ncbi:MAG: deoxyribonuclease IV [Coriobacteriia bacterium]|nr:deoxyribonuclease IV [Coriobacteriia bacterium]